MHYYRHEIGHFRAATAQLSNAQRYAYLEMIWTYYDKEEPLPDNPRKLALRIGAKQEDVELVLEVYFTLGEDGWHNKKCDDVLAEYRSFIDQKSAAGKASGRARVERPLNTRSTTEQPNQLTSKPTNQLTSVKKGRFAPPTPDELLDYANEKQLLINVGKFIDFYQSKGWMVGKNKMKDWKAAARNWSKREEENETSKRAGGSGESHHASVMRKLQSDLKK